MSKYNTDIWESKEQQESYWIEFKKLDIKKRKNFKIPHTSKQWMSLAGRWSPETKTKKLSSKAVEYNLMNSLIQAMLKQEEGVFSREEILEWLLRQRKIISGS